MDEGPGRQPGDPDRQAGVERRVGRRDGDGEAGDGGLGQFDLGVEAFATSYYLSEANPLRQDANWGRQLSSSFRRAFDAARELTAR